MEVVKIKVHGRMQFAESRDRQMNSECGFKCSRVIFLTVESECERLRVLWC
jgi:hypothetical protein